MTTERKYEENADPRQTQMQQNAEHQELLPHITLLPLFVMRHCSSLAQMLFQSFENHAGQKPIETTAFPPHFTGERLEL